MPPLGRLRQRITARPRLQQILANVSWLFADKVLRLGLGLVVGVWVARYLGPAMLGALSYATAFVGLFDPVAGLGLKGVVVRELVREPEEAGTLLGTAGVLLLLAGGLAYLLALAGILWLRADDPLAILLVAIMGSTLLFKASEVAAFWFEARVLSKYVVWVQNGCFLVIAAVKVLLILGGASVVSFAWASLAEAAATAALLVLVLRARGPGLAAFAVRGRVALRLLRESWPLLLSSVAIIIYMRIDRVMLGQLADDEAVGIYSAAARLSEAWYFVPTAIVASVFPAILRARAENDALYWSRLQRLLDLLTWLAIAAAIPTTFLAGWVITLLFGDRYAAGGSVLAVHVWASVFVFMGVATSYWMLAEGGQILALQRAVVGAVTNLCLNFVLIPPFGIDGAAWATVIAYGCSVFLLDPFQREVRRFFTIKMAALYPPGVLRRFATALREERER